MKVAFTYISPKVEVTAPVWVVAQSAGAMLVNAVTDARGMNRDIADTINSTDMALITFTKALTDAVDNIDNPPTFTFIKNLADVVNNVDAVDPKIVAFREFGETVNAVEVVAVSMIKALTDAYTSVDAARISTTKVLADAVASSDAATLSFTKALADIVTNAEARAIAVTKALTDSVTNADSGTLYMNNYADITYFAEGYVGTSTTF